MGQWDNAHDVMIVERHSHYMLVAIPSAALCNVNVCTPGRLTAAC